MILCPILRVVRDEIEGLNLKTNRRMSAFNKLGAKLRAHLGRSPTDDDLHRMGPSGVKNLTTNDAEKDVATRIGRRLE